MPVRSDLKMNIVRRYDIITRTDGRTFETLLLIPPPISIALSSESESARLVIHKPLALILYSHSISLFLT